MANMNKEQVHTVLFFGAVTLFAVVSKLIFDNVFVTANTVIDEAFHLPQGLLYCNYTFHTWDPKITTLPGLYLASTILFGPLKFCSIYWLRFTNYLASIINLILFYKVFQINNKAHSWKNIVSAINVSLLPPLYFFSHFYYTDVLSLTTVLLMVYFSSTDKHITSSIFGVFSILMRQTNVIWIVMIAGQYTFNSLFNYLILPPSNKKTTNTVSLNELLHLRLNCKSIKLSKIPMQCWINLFGYAIVVLSFIIFVILNGSIVVGDKTAHEANVHIPQMFYYSLFSTIFTFPYCFHHIRSFVQFALSNRCLILVLIVTSAVIVHFNTLIHPYLLADNRHYTFYIWNRFFQYSLFRLLVVPLYVFSLYCTVKTYYKSTDIFSVTMYIPCLLLSLCLQKMIEIRYFLIPFVLMRMQIKNPRMSSLLVEFGFYLLVNLLTLQIFFEKEIWWDDFEDVQKLIW